MSSLFSYKMKTGFRNNGSSTKTSKSCKPRSGVFGAKTRKKPPSITICLENGNVILTAPSQSGIYSDGASVSVGTNTPTNQYVSPVQDYVGGYIESPQSISPNSTLRDNEYPRKVAAYQMSRNESAPVELPGSYWFHNEATPSDLELPLHSPPLSAGNPALKSAPDLSIGLSRQVPRPRALTYTCPKSQGPASPSKESSYQYSNMCSSEDYSEKEVDEGKTNLNISGGPSEGLHIDSTELFKVCIPTETRGGW
jgi:hypothetical protein